MKFITLLLLVLLFLNSSFVIAADVCGNMTFSTLGQGGSEDLLIYTYDEANSTQLLEGQWNTSSPDVPSYCGDVNIVVRPSARSRFLNPETMLADGWGFIETYWPQLTFTAILLGYILSRR